MGERGVRRGAIPPAYWVIFSGNEVQREENPLISYGLFLLQENVRLSRCAVSCSDLCRGLFVCICAGLLRFDIHSDGPVQACFTLIYTATGRCSLATAQNTQRRTGAGLQQPKTHSDGPVQACFTLIYTATGRYRFNPKHTATDCSRFSSMASRQILRDLIGRSGVRNFCAASVFRLIK